jgi:hypothetical protein
LFLCLLSFVRWCWLAYRSEFSGGTGVLISMGESQSHLTINAQI